jgi:hypothetical protein
VFNTTFSIISAISWRPVLVVEEVGVPGENYRTSGARTANPSGTADFTLYFVLLFIFLLPYDLRNQ